MQATATRQDSMRATDTDVPRETTRASTTFGFTRRSFCGVAAATISANLLEIPGFCRGDETMTEGWLQSHNRRVEATPIFVRFM